MPGSEPPETNKAFRAEQRELVISIREDFRTLIITLEREMDSELDPDSQTMHALWKARSAAELGLRLSERLLRSIDDHEQRG